MWQKFCKNILPSLMWSVQIVNVAGLFPILWQVIATHKPSGTPMITLMGFVYIQSVIVLNSIRYKDKPMGFGMALALLITLATIILSILYTS